ncbi:MAG: class I SAM-dependent methyltransferase [Bacteroidetes bacterium]|nr:class I SAM-dependent methyltransferase [Bacteroidota bacterium]
MDFYQSISPYYQYIFPLSKIQVHFVNSAFENTAELSLLDIGCGIGNLSAELINTFRKVNGIDLSDLMLQQAKNRFSNTVDNLHFQHLSMLEIEKDFGANSFDTVVCFGNTLVHLDSIEDISDFLGQANKIMKPDGKLLLQIVNYDRILNTEIESLPTIDNAHITFERNYHFSKSEKKIYFETKLTVKESGLKLENSIPLYPLRKFEIDSLLEESGFSDVRYYGNFKREAWTPNSPALVVEVKK